MEIYRFKKDFRTNFGTHKAGDRVYKEPDDHFGYVYHPLNRGYPMTERPDFKFVDEYLEFEKATDKPKEYYINKVVCYTQEQLDEMSNKL